MGIYDIYMGKPVDDILTGFMLDGGAVRGVTRYLVNSYAQKIGNGDRTFEDDTAFDYWTVRDWSNGFGHKRPEEGYLYAHADTRFPDQLLLPIEPLPPSYVEMPHGGTNYAPGSVILYPNAGDDTQPSKACATFRVRNPSGGTAHQATVKVKAPQGANLTLSIWTLSSGRFPLVNLGSGTTPVSADRPVAEFVGVDLPQIPLNAYTEYGLVVECDQECELYNCIPYQVEGLLSTKGLAYYPTLAYWTSRGYTFQFAINMRASSTYLALQNGDYLNLNLGDPDLGIDGDWFITNEFEQRILEFAKANGAIFAAWGSFVDKWNPGSSKWENIYDSGGPQVQDILSLDDKIFIALGANGYVVYDPQVGSTTSHPSLPASLLYEYRGYLWRAHGNEVWYTSDLTTWTGPYATCRDPYNIRGMAGMGELVYFGCDDGLYYLDYGDFAKQVAEWPSKDQRNGVRMTTWQGNLYIPLADDIIQYTPAGVMLQMGLKVGEGLPADLQGDAFYLHGTTYFLLCIVDPLLDYGAPSMWAYNGQGWHNILRLPQGAGAGALYLDTENNTLWIGSGRSAASTTTYPPAVINPIRDFNDITFSREGWIEFDEFDGRLLELMKDAEAMYINGEFISGDLGEVRIYWKADDEATWSLLGEVDSDHEFIRWSDYTTRPEFRTIRLGISIKTNTPHSSPVIRAHMFKFLAIASDRYGWQLRILVSDFLETLGGDVPDTYDKRSEYRDKLDELEREVAPVLFTDVDDKTYEVRITAARRDVSRYEVDADGNKKFDTIHSITAEQVVPYEYGG